MHLRGTVVPAGAVHQDLAGAEETDAGGHPLNGAAAGVVVRTGGERTALGRDAIESIRGTGRSLMPEGFGRAIPPEEFADLLAFLRQGRVIGPPP